MDECGMEADISKMENEGAPASEKWTSWQNPVADPERWIEIRRAVEAGMSQKEASDVFKISYEAIKKRAQREEWLTENRIKEAKEAKIASLVPAKSLAPQNALQAVAESFESHRSGTLLNLAKLAGKGIQRAIDANLNIENWQDAKIAADIAMKLHNVGQESVQVNIAQAFAGMDEGPLVSISGDLDEGETVEATYFVDDE